jgi:hypothetical protein
MFTTKLSALQRTVLRLLDIPSRSTTPEPARDRKFEDIHTEMCGKGIARFLSRYFARSIIGIRRLLSGQSPALLWWLRY